MIPIEYRIEMAKVLLAEIFQKASEPIQVSIPETVDWISEYVEAGIYQNFLIGGRPAWPSRKHKYAHPMLMKSLKMMELSLATARHWFHEDRNHHIDIESTDYAIHQQEGTYPGGYARVFADIPDDELDVIEVRLADAIEALF